MLRGTRVRSGQKGNAMQRYVLLAANLALLICSVAFDPSRAHAQNNEGSSPITFDVTMKPELSGVDGSYVHVLMQGKYEVEPQQLAPSDIKDGQSYSLYLEYLDGGPNLSTYSFFRFSLRRVYHMKRPQRSAEGGGYPSLGT
jgi:hypothetical protein